ncbi:MAG: TAXI family TRAP transporter solute-binding subunit [Roseinatronobacter sp.]|nr:TAXI family TRAP transporter solute-binding subunit [Roseinatronobacter sp.]
MKHLTFGLALSLGMGLSASAQAQVVGIATSNPGSIFHNIGTAVASAASTAGMNVTIQPATSPNQYIPLVNSGGIEFGVANLQEVAYAFEGREWFSGSENSNLRVAALIMPLINSVFVRADSDIFSHSDLRGKPMVDGYTAQQTILPQLDAIYATEGMTRADLIPVNVASVVAGADAFIAGDTVGFVFAQGAGKVREADAAVGGLRALPIDPSEENLALLREHWPVGYFEFITAGSTPGVEEDGWFFAYPQLIFTHSDVADDVVYNLVKALAEGTELLSATFPPFAAFDPQTNMVRDTGIVAYHPGAIRYYEEAGLWTE